MRNDSSMSTERFGNTLANGGDLALRARGIRKSYPTPSGRLDVLTGVDLDVPRGTILAILGLREAARARC